MLFFRKLLYGFLLVFLTEVKSKLLLLMALNSIYLGFILIRKPFKRVSDNLRVFITELVTVIGIGLSLKLVIDNSEDEDLRFL